MGCCHSQPDDHPPAQPHAGHAAAPPGDGNASSASLNRVAPAAAIGASSSGSPNATARSPLNLPTPIRNSPTTFVQSPAPWTRRTLNAQREAFWDTRVSPADPIRWQALRLACERLMARDVADAQAILDSAGLICPSGNVACKRDEASRKWGVYDVDSGARFYVPPWVISDPLDLVEEKEGEEDGEEQQRQQSDGLTVVVEKEGDDASAVGKREEESDMGEDDITAMKKSASQPQQKARTPKGKGRFTEESLGEQMTVRCRPSDRRYDLIVTFRQAELVSAIKERVREQIGPQQTVRLMYRGKPLNEHKTLADQGWVKGTVINTFITPEIHVSSVA